MKLKHTSIYRGGVTAPALVFETADCDVDLTPKDQALQLRFHLASKGGGTTQVLIEMKTAAIKNLLHLLAQHHSDAPEILTESVLASLAAERSRRESLVKDAQSIQSELAEIELNLQKEWTKAPGAVPTTPVSRWMAVHNARKKLDRLMGKLDR